MFFRTIFLLVFCIFKIILLAFTPVSGLQILAIESVAGKSHWNFMSAVLRTLTDSGHNVTVFTPFPDGNRANYTEVDLSNDLPIKVAMNAEETTTFFVNPSIILPTIMNLSRDSCHIIYEKPQMKDILNKSKSNYDVVISEIVASECASYAAKVLNLPLIYVIPSPMITHLEHTLLGHVPNPATISHVMARHAVPRTFTQRFFNFVLLVYSVFILKQNEILLKKTQLQTYDLIEPQQSSIIFLNTHFITETPRPMLPSVIQIGGIHLKTHKRIPNDVLEFIENSPHGVIYFTFGSVVSMSTLPEHVHNAFKHALAQVPQRVLWKYEGEMKDKPKNVMTSKWFPQRDILMHPKVKLFISHGGISGVYEAVDAAVPVLGFPLFYDQPRNIENLVDAGMAISMDLMSINKELLLKNILELVNNEKYTKNAKTASDRFKDRPMTPAQSVVYWTEYVVRHKGASHLKSHALNLTWYQYFLLDVIVVLLISIIVIFFLVYYIFRFFYNYLFKCYQNSKVKSE